MRRAPTILGCLVAVALAGCSSSASTSGPSGAAPSSGSGATASAASAGSSGTPASVGALPDACSLLTTGEIEGIVGHSVMDGAGSGKDCQWQRTDPHQVSVALHVIALPGTLKCQTVGSAPITDLGVEAAWHYLPDISTGSVTACTSGRLQAQISLVGDLVTHTTTEDQLRADGVALMRLVLPRL
jgi:hypothetical protein